MIDLRASTSDLETRSATAIYFAMRQDPVCARTIYRLLEQEDKLEPWRQSNILQAMQTLTGSSFGFSLGTISTPDVRKAGLAQLDHWIQDSVK